MPTTHQVSPHSGNHEDIALDQPAQCRRYGRTAMTLHRWRDNPAIAYPKPSFYIAGVPYIWLSVLQDWERARPGHSKLAGKSPRELEAAA